jgi:hypothetical protein
LGLDAFSRATVFLSTNAQRTKAKLRLEVFYKIFHPRMNQTTLCSTKSSLLNTIKPFLCHERQPFQGGILRNLNFKILSILFCFWTPRY